MAPKVLVPYAIIIARPIPHVGMIVNQRPVISAKQGAFHAEIAVYLGASKDSVYRWVETRHLPAHKIGRRWKFKPSGTVGDNLGFAQVPSD